MDEQPRFRKGDRVHFHPDSQYARFISTYKNIAVFSVGYGEILAVSKGWPYTYRLHWRPHNRYLGWVSGNDLLLALGPNVLEETDAET